MTVRGLGTRVAAGAFWLSVAFGAGPGCDAPTVSRSAPLEPAEDPFPVVSRCENSTVRVAAPRRIDDGSERCGEEYEVDFVVEGRPADAMLLDMFQSHMLLNWRVDATSETVRHEFTLRLLTREFWSPNPPGIRSHEPIVVQRCPEGNGEGPVLACTTVGCGIYDDPGEVPRLIAADLQVAVTMPFALHETIPMREGETLEIPVTFRVLNPKPGGMTFSSEFGLDTYLEPYADVKLAPAEIHLPTQVAGVETRLVFVTLERFDHEGFKAIEPTIDSTTVFGFHPSPRAVQLRFDTSSTGESGCIIQPPGFIWLLLSDP